MKSQRLSTVCIQLIFTKEGKAFLHQSIQAFFLQWAKGSIIRKVVAKLIVVCISPFVKVQKEDIPVETLLNDEQWWNNVGKSVMHAIATHDMAVAKKYAESLGKHVPNILGMIANGIWMYPAKVVALLSCIPSLVNCAIRAIHTTLKPINEQAPDLLADVVNSLLKEIDTSALGGSANQLSELIRKLNTGDELIRESAFSPLENTITHIIAAVVNGTGVDDSNRFFNNILSLKNKLRNGVCDALSGNPDTVRAVIHYVLLNTLHKISTTRKLLNEYSVQDSVDIPVEEIAYLINDMMRLGVLLHHNNKLLFDSLVHRFAHSLDTSTIEEFVSKVGNDCFAALQPVLVRVFSFVLKCWTTLLYNQSSEMQEARKAFARALLRDVEE
ncbi:MAG: hypothetical protein N3F66_04885 [Spirochaetes bacterium]|nr:hypothetical protein [Spirochaetota bacterium]